MKITQISVFLENKAGQFAEVASILAEADINIKAISLADRSDFGVLRIIVNENQKAAAALKSNGFSVTQTDVVAVAVSDRPGGLHHILAKLDQANLNVEYIYAFVRQRLDKAVMIFKFEDNDLALDLLKSNNIAVLSEKELHAL